MHMNGGAHSMREKPNSEPSVDEVRIGYCDAGTARRAARALNHIVQSAGGKPSAF